MVDNAGIEPAISGCKPDVFPLALIAHYCFTTTMNRLSKIVSHTANSAVSPAATPMFMERKEIKNPSVGRSLVRYKRSDETETRAQVNCSREKGHLSSTFLGRCEKVLV